MEENKSTNIKGLKIRTFNTCMIVICTILYIILLLNLAYMPYRYQQVIKHTDEYIACQKNAATLYSASDYLTEQVRLYTQNMDLKYMEAYFKEANETKRRESALEEMKSLGVNQAAQEDLALALTCSNHLMEREIYAMKLISTANGYADELLPEEVRNTPLKAVDKDLGYDEMVAKARDLVFNEGYQDAKSLIYSHLSHFLNAITDNTKDSQMTSIQDMKAALMYERIIVSILFAANVTTFVIITILIVKPLRIHIKKIKANSALEIMGAYEFRYLALTYNDIYELNIANKKLLVEKAEHDALTGVLYRTAWDGLKDLLKDNPAPFALAVIDVDKFKIVNDSFGHEIGDEILKKVAHTLETHFRSGDYVIRYGGDEFLVVLMGATKENKQIIVKKFDIINQILAAEQDGLPPISLSVGLTFSEAGFEDAMFKEADGALYEAKQHGRSRCHVFQEDANRTDDE